MRRHGMKSAPVDSHSPMILTMIDWRGCSAVEYVPGRKSGSPTFIGRRVPVQGLTDWLRTGRTLETFSETFQISMDAVTDAYLYMTDNPPVETVDLADCPAVQLNPADMLSFKGTHFPVVALFDFLKAGRTPREFSETYGLDHEQVETVLRHATAQNVGIL
ncbi:MAG: DUF433 domain-containing protein [Acidimicrobiia bacterium]|nr:DUF433 domain-containing protein [Acidimicrobiia bacterium]